jgi:hypothetical protein
VGEAGKNDGKNGMRKMWKRKRKIKGSRGGNGGNGENEAQKWGEKPKGCVGQEGIVNCFWG